MVTIGLWLYADVLPTAVAATVLLAGSSEAGKDQVPPHRSIDAAGYVLLALAAAGLLLRRHAPTAMLMLESLLVGGYLAAGYPHGPVFLTVAVAAYTVGLRLEPRASVVAAGVATSLLVTGSAVAVASDYADGGWTYVFTLTATVVVAGVPALIGALLRKARQAAALADEEATRRRIDQERLRMAREVHDVVGHSLSVISLQAGVALHVLDRRPEQAQVSLEAIRRTSVEALEELRATLALTRAERTPLTGLDRLPGLLTEVRLVGLPVETVVEGNLAALPAEVDLAAFRVVQESLTNVLRHAGRSRVHVELRLTAGQLTVDVTDTPEPSDVPAPLDASAGHPAPSDALDQSGHRRSGHGLAGLRERAAELGGSVSAGPRPGGGWQVRAVLPTVTTALSGVTV